jgi:hypothetical protein
MVRVKAHFSAAGTFATLHAQLEGFIAANAEFVFALKSISGNNNLLTSEANVF